MNTNKVIKIQIVSLLLLALATPVFAASEDQRWVVAGIEGGAWKSTDRDPSVRTAVNPGDVILPTDRLETFQNNQVTLAMDPRGKNMVSVRGVFRVQSSERGSRLEMERGHALAVLDDLKGRGDFSVGTPTGVAAVRGTRFSVDAPSVRMDVQTYRGEVQVYAPETHVSSVSVEKGKKTTLESGARGKPSVADLSSKDWQEYGQSLRSIRSARKSLESNGQHWFEESERPSRTRWVPAIEPGAGDTEKKGRTIVF